VGKKLTHAPVYFTVAEVRFSPVLSLESYVPKIQEHLRRLGYPAYQAAEVLTLKVIAAEAAAGASPISQRLPRHVFMDIGKTAAFVLTSSALSFHTTQYDVFETFLREVTKGLDVVHETVTLAYTDRIGIRYLDAVLPGAGEAIDRYLIPEVLGLSAKSGGILEQSFSETRRRLPNGQLIARCLIRNGRVGLPGDLQTVGLTLPERVTLFDGAHASLDTDAYFQGRESFATNTVQEHLDSLHNEIAAAFRSTVTNHALTAWE
jgi:uncharacterized protein (TIGR04255 family)